MVSRSPRISRQSKSPATERSSSVVVRAAKPVPEIHELVDRRLVVCHQDEGTRKSFSGLTPKRKELNKVDNTGRNLLQRQLAAVGQTDAPKGIRELQEVAGTDAR